MLAVADQGVRARLSSRGNSSGRALAGPRAQIVADIKAQYPRMRELSKSLPILLELSHNLAVGQGETDGGFVDLQAIAGGVIQDMTEELNICVRDAFRSLPRL